MAIDTEQKDINLYYSLVFHQQGMQMEKQIEMRHEEADEEIVQLN